MSNLFKKKYLRVPHLSFSNAIREAGRNPFVDWIIILIVSIVLTIIFILVSLQLYRSVISGDIKSTDAVVVPTIKTFDREELSSVINRFNSKEATSVQVKKGYVGPADPSL